MGLLPDTDLTHCLADSLAVGDGYLNLPELVQDLFRAMTFPRHVYLPSRVQYPIFQLDSFEGVRSLDDADNALFGLYDQKPRRLDEPRN